MQPAVFVCGISWSLAMYTISACSSDFRIDDVLNPAPPAVCDSPVPLIRNAAGAWFAAGIPRR